MKDFKKVIEFLNYKISGGGDFSWKCFENNAKYLDFDSYNLTMIFNGLDHTIYVIEHIQDDTENILNYTYINPKFKDLYLKECEEKKANGEVTIPDHEHMHYYDDVSEFLKMVGTI